MIKFCIKSWVFVSLIRKLHNKHAKSGYVCCGQQQNISFCNKTYMHCTVWNQCTHKCVNIHTPVLNSKIKKTNPMRSNFHYRWYHLFTHTHFVCTHNKTLLCFMTEIQKKSFVVFFFCWWRLSTSLKSQLLQWFLIRLKWSKSYFNNNKSMHTYYHCCNTAKLFPPH